LKQSIFPSSLVYAEPKRIVGNCKLHVRRHFLFLENKSDARSVQKDCLDIHGRSKELDHHLKLLEQVLELELELELELLEPVTDLSDLCAVPHLAAKMVDSALAFLVRSKKGFPQILQH
jgi:hypothetical protein